MYNDKDYPWWILKWNRFKLRIMLWKIKRAQLKIPRM